MQNYEKGDYKSMKDFILIRRYFVAVGLLLTIGYSYLLEENSTSVVFLLVFSIWAAIELFFAKN